MITLFIIILIDKLIILKIKSCLEMAENGENAHYTF